MPPWLLVTPASRGIGLALARKLLRSTTLPLVATARRSVEDTKRDILADQSESSLSSAVDDAAADRLHVLPLDVTDEASIEAAAAECDKLFPSGEGGKAGNERKNTNSNNSNVTPSWLHAAFFLPGVLHPEKSTAQLDADDMLHTFRVNTIGPLLLLKHFAPYLPRKATNVELGDGSFLDHSSSSSSSKVVLPRTHSTTTILSARVGSISDNQGLGGWYSYRASKAAVNQITRTFDNGLRRSAGANAMAMAYHPGTVKTGLSKQFWGGVPEGKLFSPEFTVERLLGVVSGFDGDVERGRGRCWDWDGKEILP